MDVLGLEASGRLVVVEIKRADSGSDVHLQAITYAALVSRFDKETLSDAHQQHLARRGASISRADAVESLVGHAGDLDPDLLRSPRIVLIAGSFPKQVTTTCVWLSEQGLDVALVSVTAWRVAGQVAVGFSKVYPTPEVEEFALAPVRAEREEVVRMAADRSRSATTVRRLVEAAALADGTLREAGRPAPRPRGGTTPPHPSVDGGWDQLESDGSGAQHPGRSNRRTGRISSKTVVVADRGRRRPHVARRRHEPDPSPRLVRSARHPGRHGARQLDQLRRSGRGHRHC